MSTKISSGKTQFEIDGFAAWEMPILGTIKAVEAAQKAAAEAKDADFDANDVLIQLVQDAGGPALTVDQADELWDEMNNLYVLSKKKRKDAMLAGLQSLGSST